MMNITITHLHIENFRCISDFDYNLSAQLNVLVGINGSGKSSVLAAIDILMSWFIARLRNVKGNGLSLKDHDIMDGRNYCRLEISLSNGVCWKLYYQHSKVRTKPIDKSNLQTLTEFANSVVMANQGTDCIYEVPLYVQYGVTRTVDSVPAKIHKKHALGIYDVYNKDYEKKMNFQSFFVWFREREDMENEQLRETGELTEDIQLKAVRNAVSLILPEFGGLKVKRTAPSGFMISKNGQRYMFNQLSDGEKSYIVLVADIARKLSMTHPNSENVLLEHSIIIVDEVDLHLHPKWQRDMLHQLRKVFPNCQFIVSTHSPYVISNIKSREGDCLFLLKGGETVLCKQNVYGKSVTDILLNELEQFSLRSQEVQSHIDKVWECLRVKDCSSVAFNSSLKWLEDNLEPSDSELMRISMQKHLFTNRQYNETH